jgi:hypothetical protein
MVWLEEAKFKLSARPRKVLSSGFHSDASDVDLVVIDLMSQLANISFALVWVERGKVLHKKGQPCNCGTAEHDNMLVVITIKTSDLLHIPFFFL